MTIEVPTTFSLSGGKRYVCEVCGELYPSAFKAADCEAKHAATLSTETYEPLFDHSTPPYHHLGADAPESEPCPKVERVLRAGRESLAELTAGRRRIEIEPGDPGYEAFVALLKKRTMERDVRELARIVAQAEVDGARTDAWKADSGKAPWHLLPYDAVGGIVQILAFGAGKYSERNWEQGMDWSRCFAALQRHLVAWWNREGADPETGKSHLWHAGCCLLFLIAYEIRGVGRDDRPA